MRDAEVERLRKLPLEEFKIEWDELLKRIRAMGKPTLLERIKDFFGLTKYDEALLDEVHDCLYGHQFKKPKEES